MSHTDKCSAVVELMKEFEATAESSYRLFLAERVKVTTNPDTILGIRMGVIRRFARTLSKLITYENTLELLYPKAIQWYEYKLLFGLIVQRVLPLVRVGDVLPLFYNLCDGWAVPDLYQSILGDFAARGALRDVVLSVEANTTSPNPFARRLTVVVQMPLNKLELVPIEDALHQCQRLQWDNEYLVQMGVAWTLAELYIQHPEEVNGFIQSGEISSEPVLKKYRQKLRDSLRLKN